MGSSEERDVGAGYGRSQLPVAMGCGQERGSTSHHLHWHPRSLSPPPFIPSIVIFVSLSPHHEAHDENPGAGCRWWKFGVPRAWLGHVDPGGRWDPQRIPPSSALMQRLQLVGTVQAIREGFSSQKPSIWVAKTQRWKLGWGWSWDGAGTGMKPPWGLRAPARPAQPGTLVGPRGDSDPPTAQSHCRDRLRGHC